jgi:hypothetical protein
VRSTATSTGRITASLIARQCRSGRRTDRPLQRISTPRPSVATAPMMPSVSRGVSGRERAAHRVDHHQPIRPKAAMQMQTTSAAIRTLELVAPSCYRSHCPRSGSPSASRLTRFRQTEGTETQHEPLFARRYELSISSRWLWLTSRGPLANAADDQQSLTGRTRPRSVVYRTREVAGSSPASSTRSWGLPQPVRAELISDRAVRSTK